jgi:hypothetical protein
MIFSYIGRYKRYIVLGVYSNTYSKDYKPIEAEVQL